MKSRLIVWAALHDYTQSGLTVHEVAAKYGVSWQHVRRWLQQAGRKFRRPGRRKFVQPTNRDRRILELVQTHTYEQVARKFGLTKQAVGLIVRRWSHLAATQPPPFEPGDVVEWNGRRCTVLEADRRCGLLVDDGTGHEHHCVPWKLRHREIKKVGRELSAETDQPQGNALLRPTYRHCVLVYRALRAEPAFRARFGRMRDSVYRRDGKRFTFPREVFRVATRLREHGSSGGSATSAQILRAASAVLGPHPSDFA